jgi:hypothetical protein
MAIIRTLTQSALAALTLMLAAAQAQSAGPPLSLLPPAAKAESPTARIERPHTTVAPRARAARKIAKKRVANRHVAATHHPRALAGPSLMMQDDDSGSLMTKLPWWQPAIMSEEDFPASQVRSAANAWLDAHGGGAAAYASTSPAQLATSPDIDSVVGQSLAEPSDLSTSDRLLAPAPEPQSWLSGLLALSAGAIAAMLAAFLLVRSGRRRRAVVLSPPGDV